MGALFYRIAGAIAVSGFAILWIVGAGAMGFPTVPVGDEIYPLAVKGHVHYLPRWAILTLVADLVVMGVCFVPIFGMFVFTSVRSIVRYRQTKAEADARERRRQDNLAAAAPALDDEIETARDA